ncbi:hypothetical protein HDV00_012673 [Rhizophlyctis rosea]|nr:hypothetical protein HDV00_012673 [Rhizophlyctis rosea]
MPNESAATLVGLAALTASVVALLFGGKRGAGELEPEPIEQQVAGPPAKKPKRKRSSSKLEKPVKESGVAERGLELIPEKSAVETSKKEIDIPRSLPAIAEVEPALTAYTAKSDVPIAPSTNATASILQPSATKKTASQKKQIKRKKSKRDLATKAVRPSPTGASAVQEDDKEEEEPIAEDSIEDLILLGALSGRAPAVSTAAAASSGSTKRKRSKKEKEAQQEVPAPQVVEPTPTPSATPTPVASPVTTPSKAEASAPRNLDTDTRDAYLTPPRSTGTSTPISPSRLAASLPTPDTTDAQVLSTRLSFLDAELTRLNAGSAQKAAEVAALKAEVAALKNENFALKAEKGRFVEEVQQKDSKIAEEVKVLRDTNRVLTRNLGDVQVQLRDMKASYEKDLATSQKTITTLQSLLDKSQSQAALQPALDKARAEVEAFKGLNAQLRDMVAAREGEMDNIRSELAVKDGVVEELKANVDDTRGALVGAGKEVGRLEGVVGELKAEVEREKSGRREVEAEVGGLKKKVGELEGEKKTLVGQVEGAKKSEAKVKALEGDLKNVREEFERCEVQAELFRKGVFRKWDEVREVIKQNIALRKEIEALKNAPAPAAPTQVVTRELKDPQISAKAAADFEAVAGYTALVRSLAGGLEAAARSVPKGDGKEVEALNARAAKAEAEVKVLKDAAGARAVQNAEGTEGYAALVRSLASGLESAKAVKPPVTDGKDVNALKAKLAEAECTAKAATAEVQQLKNAQASRAVGQCEGSEGYGALVRSLSYGLEAAAAAKKGPIVDAKEVDALKTRLAATEGELQALKAVQGQKAAREAEALAGYTVLVRTLSSSLEASHRQVEAVGKEILVLKEAAVKTRAVEAVEKVTSTSKSADSAIAAAESASGYAALVRSLGREVESSHAALESSKQVLSVAKNDEVEKLQKEVKGWKKEVDALKWETKELLGRLGRSGQAEVAKAEVDAAQSILIRGLSHNVEIAHRTAEQKETQIASIQNELLSSKKDVTSLTSRLADAKKEVEALKWEIKELLARLGRSGYPMSENVAKFQAAQALEVVAGQSALVAAMAREVEDAYRGREAVVEGKRVLEREVEELRKREVVVETSKKEVAKETPKIVDTDAIKFAEATAAQGVLIRSLAVGLEGAVAGRVRAEKKVEELEKKAKETPKAVEKVEASKSAKKADGSVHDAVKAAEAAAGQASLIRSLAKAVEDAHNVKPEVKGVVKEVVVERVVVKEEKAKQKGDVDGGVKSAEALAGQASLIRALAKAVEDGQNGKPDVKEVVVEKVVVKEVEKVGKKVEADGGVKSAEAIAGQASLIRALAKAVEEGRATGSAAPAAAVAKDAVVERASGDDAKAQAEVAALRDELKAVRMDLEGEIARADQVRRIRKVLEEVYLERIQNFGKKVEGEKKGLEGQIRAGAEKGTLDFSKLQAAQARLDAEKAKLVEAVKKAAAEKIEADKKLDEYQARIVEYEGKVKTLSVQLATVCESTAFLESQVTKLTTQKTTLERAHAALENQHSALQSSHGQLMKTHSITLHELEDAKRHQPTAQLWRQVDDLKNQLHLARGEVENARSEKRGLTVRAEVAERKTLVYKKRAEDAAEQVEMLEKKVKESGASNGVAGVAWEEEEKTKELLKKVEEYRAQVESAEHRLVVWKQRAERVEALEGEKEGAVKAKKEVDEALVRAVEEKESALADIKKVVEEAESAKRTLAEKEERFGQLEADMSAMTKQIAELEERYKGDVDRAKAEQETLILRSAALEAEKEKLRREWDLERRRLEVSGKVFEAKWKRCEEEIAGLKKTIEGGEKMQEEECGCGEEHRHAPVVAKAEEIVDQTPRDSAVAMDGAENGAGEGSAEGAKKKKKKNKKGKK